MSIARRPFRLLATLLVVSLVAALPISDAVATQRTGAPEGGSQVAPSPAAWWVDWLEAFDKDGNRIEDQADAIAARRIAADKADALVPVLVWFRPPPVDMKGFLARVGAAADAYVFKTQPIVDLNIPAAHLDRLSTAPGVVAVQYDRPLYPHLNVSAPATQANRGSGANTFYNGRTAEDLGYTGRGMTVAVLDTGVQDQHAAFTGKWIAGTDVSPQLPVGTCLNAVDDDGHGTHVASTAVGASGANLGTAKDAKLVEVRIAVAGATATAGPASIGSTNRGFEFVKLYNDRLAAGNPLCGPNDDHIDVATLSFGSLGRGGPNAGTTEPFIDALVNSGVAVTVAVGNCGPSPSATCTFGDDDNGISSPGNAAGAIGVASFNDMGTVDRANDAISSFSSRGPNNSSGSTDAAAGGATSAANLDDRFRKPDIAAPGDGITAAGPVPFTNSTLSGTSMATPHVAGIAALLLQTGEEVKAQTGGTNLMASTGHGFVGGDYTPGAYPVRDALIHATDYKSSGAKSLWTGPNSRGMQWNNAWGYGQVNAFGAVCWAWANVLVPGGATPPQAVADNCSLGVSDGDGDGVPDTSDNCPSVANAGQEDSDADGVGDACEGGAADTDGDGIGDATDNCPNTSNAGQEDSDGDGQGDACEVVQGPSSTYYFHSLSGDNTLDQTQADGATFDTTKPTFGPDQYSQAIDLPGFQNAGAIEVVDPTWRGTTNERATSIGVDFWGLQEVDQSQGEAHYTVRVLPEGATSYIELLPAIERTSVPPGLVNIKHTFTSMRTTAAGAPEPLNLPAGKLTFTIRGTFVDSDVHTELRFDSTNYPASFTTNVAVASPSPSSSQTASPDPTTPPPAAGCGTYPAPPNDPFFVDAGIIDDASGGQWGLRKVNAPQAWQEPQATGCGINIAVLDSGIDLGDGGDLHPDFGCPGKVQIVPDSDFVQNDNTPNDENGHGTHVAGIVGACTDNETGVAGVAPDSTIIPIRVLDAEGSGDAPSLAQAIEKATDSGAHVINMSLGFPSAVAPVELVDHLFPEIDAAIEHAVSNGVVVVAAAGNESFPLCAIPAIAEDVVCVGSSDTRDLNSWYGNFPIKHDADDDGPEEAPVDLPLGPGLLAPGGSGVFGNAFCEQTDEEIMSTWLRAGDECGEQGYQAIFGTSMASPHVAGTAALVYNRLNGERNAENARAVVDAIIGNTEDLYTPGWDPLSGYGRLDASAAVLSVDPVTPTPTAALTTTEFTVDSATAGQFSDEATVAAKVTKTADGGALSGAEVLFELTGDAGSKSWTATTGEDGVASKSIVLDQAPGSYVLTARYAGEENVYAASADLSSFVIDKDDSSTDLTASGTAPNRTFRVVVADSDSGTGLGGVVVEFFEDGVSIGTATTDESGVATFAGKTKKKSLYEAVFGGDAHYASSRDSFREK